MAFVIDIAQDVSTIVDVIVAEIRPGPREPNGADD